MELEAGPEKPDSLKLLAQSCQARLRSLSEAEEEQHAGTRVRKRNWASQQSVEFNLWCSRVGMKGNHGRSLEARLEDAPEVCNILRHLLQSLGRDLNELSRPAEATARPEPVQYDWSGFDYVDPALSFRCLSSSEGDEGDEDFDEYKDVTLDSEKRIFALWVHVEDTIDRLRGISSHVQHAGEKHRRERLKAYQEKEDSKQIYENFKKLAARRINDEFELATDNTKHRIAESIARRKIRFLYLEQHRKQREIQSAPKDSPPSEQHRRPVDLPVSSEDKQDAPSNAIVSIQPRLQTANTIYSATEDTKLDFSAEPKRQERAESVVSTLLNHDLPRPPRISGGSFQCPYCHIELHAREAEKERWIRHIVQDFEPYFCTFEECKAPFDVPTTFNGLLAHLRNHVPVRYHIDMPDGKHRALEEKEFEKYVKQSGEVSEQLLATMKETRRWRGPFLFDSCPFCGGYPDVLEKQFPNPNSPDAQEGLREHIKKHMQHIALVFFPPYREDDPGANDFSSSVKTSKHSRSQKDAGATDECNTICDRGSCDCKDDGKYSKEDTMAVPSLTAFEEESSEESPRDREAADFWSDLIRDPKIYDRSAVTDDYYINDEHLVPFLLRTGSKPPANVNYKVAWICTTETNYYAARAFLDEKHASPDYLWPDDNNEYTLGKIGQHNVVIAVLPGAKYGTSSAEDVATNLVQSFSNIRITFVVSIGGGAPSRDHDIRLGDVVVGFAADGICSRMRYDFFRTGQRNTKQGEYLSARLPEQTPKTLQTGVTRLRGQYEYEGHRLDELLNIAFVKNSKLQRKFKRPDSSSDMLYKSDTRQRDDDSSGEVTPGPQASKFVERPERTQDEDDPAIHYGCIASTSQLPDNSSMRDKIAADDKILCFETGARGLSFPCLVICGICDYSDSNKNTEWQGYAAMTAAAYAGELVRQLRSNIVEEASLKESQTPRNSIHSLPSEKVEAVTEVSHASFGLDHFATAVPEGKVETQVQVVQKYQSGFRISPRIEELYRARAILHQALNKKFTESEQLPGKIYIAIDIEDPTLTNHFLVGHLRKGNSVWRRFETDSCMRKESLRFVAASDSEINSARRVEWLVSKELHSQHKEVICKYCSHRHINWFKESLQTVVRAVNRWTLFTSLANSDDSRAEVTRRMNDFLVARSGLDNLVEDFIVASNYEPPERRELVVFPKGKHFKQMREWEVETARSSRDDGGLRLSPATGESDSTSVIEASSFKIVEPRKRDLFRVFRA